MFRKHREHGVYIDIMSPGTGPHDWEHENWVQMRRRIIRTLWACLRPLCNQWAPLLAFLSAQAEESSEILYNVRRIKNGHNY